MRVRDRMFDATLFFLVVLGAFVVLIPLVWAFFGSFKSTSEVFKFTLPTVWHVENYVTALQSGNWPRYFANSAIMAGGIAISQTLFGSMAGYGLSKFDFPGRNLAFALVIGTLTLSQQVVFLPLFRIVSALNWIDTYQGLIVPLMVAPFSIFLVRQYIVGIHDSILEVARIDGVSEPRIFFQIIMPLSKPVLVVVFILSFTVFYNDLLWPLIVVRSESMNTVSLALQQFRGAYYYRPELVLAITMLVIAPITLLFLVLQRFFMTGVSLGGEKE